MPAIKRQLHALCLAHIDSRIKAANEVILQTQHSANDETKSSAGDKYETGRAMAQLEIEKTQTQLHDAQQQRKLLLQLDAGSVLGVVQPGSLVFTSQGNFYIAIAAGQFTVEGTSYFSVSPYAPLSQKLLGLEAGAKFALNGKEFNVISVE